jgi:WD40 repeat protein
MRQMSASTTVFISYAHADGSTLAAKLSEDLAARGYQVWRDKQRLQGAANWSREIEGGLDAADVVVALLSSGSLESEVCRGEQLRSLRRRKCVIPLLVHANSDRPVYLEARQYRDFSDASLYSLTLEDLIQDIDSRVGAKLTEEYRETRYETVPPMPENFVSRPDELETLRREVLNDRERRNVALVALKGMGGIGKTVLAQALCADEAVKAAFPDGIVWIKIGEGATEADLVNQMREAGKALVKSSEGFDTLEGSSRLLRSLLKGKSVLLVLDDVWKAEHVYPFQPTEPRFCRVLFTTRNADVGAATGARICLLDLLSAEKSREILSRSAGLGVEELPREAEDIIRECGRLPLAVAMIGALLKTKSAANLLHKLRSADLAAIHLQSYPTLFAAIQVSVNELGGDQDSYLSLSVFPEDTPIPEEALEVLWNVDKFQAQDVADRFVSLSLASRDDLRRLSLHDLQVDYIRTQAGDVRALHLGFLKRYREHCSEGWHTGPNDGYFLEHLAYHLKAAGCEQELHQLLLSFDWIRAKLAACNVVRLLADYDFLLASAETLQATASEPLGERISIPPWMRIKKGNTVTGADHNPIKIVQAAIRLSGHILAKDKEQLASQLLGRLLEENSKEIRGLLEATREWGDGPRLRPLAPTLTQPGGPLVRTLTGHSGKVTAIAVTPDGRLLVSGSEDGMLKAWDVATGQEVRSLKGHEAQVDSIVVTPDGKLLVTAADDGMLKVWNLVSWEEVCQLQGEKSRIHAEATGPAGSAWVTSGLAITPDGKVLILTPSEATPQFWEIGSWRSVGILMPATIAGKPVAVMPDGERVVFKSAHEAKMVDLSGKEILAFPSYDPPFTPMAIAITPDGKLLISGADNGTLTIWESSTAKEKWSIGGHKGWIRAVAVTPDGMSVISGGDDKVVRVWNLETGREESALTGHTSEVNAVATAPNGELAFSCSSDRTVKIWDLKSGQRAMSSPPHADEVSAVVVTPDSRVAISASFDGTLKLWEVNTARELGLLGAHTQRVKRVGAVAVTPDGKHAISASHDGTLKVWDIASRRELKSLKGRSARFTAVATEPSGVSVISADNDGALRLWNLTTGEEVWSLQDQVDRWARQLAVTADGKLLISPSRDRTLKVRELASGRELRSMRGHSAEVHGVAVTPDGKWIISASHDKTLKVWELESGREVRTLVGHRNCVLAVAAIPDGKRVVSVSHDCTVRVWDLSEGNVIATFTADAAMYGCAVASDGGTVVAGDALGRVHFLKLEGASMQHLSTALRC